METGPARNGTAIDADSRLVTRAVRQAQEGDHQALGFLYARYADGVCTYVRGIVRDHHEAEDITQQVFAKLLVAIGKYEQREVPFFAWLLRVARNVAVDHIRRNRAVPVEDVRLVEEGATAADRHGTHDLREALATLPSEQREVVVLRHFAGLSPGDIATLTGRTESSVHGLHHRGRRALARELAERDVRPTTATLRRRS